MVSAAEEHPSVVEGAAGVVLSPQSASASVTPGCFKVTTATHTSIEVCGPESDPAWMKYANVASAAGTLAVGVAAALVAYWTFNFMRTQGQQARADSVRDEYWLRTVVSPTSIEPFQSFIAGLRRDLPGVAPPLTVPTEAELNVVFAKTVDSFNDFSLKFKSLALIDDKLNGQVEIALQGIEEDFTEYVGSLRLHLISGSPPPNRSDAVADLTNGMVALFKLIQAHQVKGS